MSNELLRTLEEKVQSTVDVIENLRLQNAELKNEVLRLREEKAGWEEKLTELINRFEQLEGEEVESESEEGGAIEAAESDAATEVDEAYGEEFEEEEEEEEGERMIFPEPAV